MANVNSGKPVRFRDGGQIILDPGGDDETILNIVDGTYSERIGMRTPIVDRSRGAMAANVREGDEQPCEIAFDVKYTSDAPASHLRGILTARKDTPDGYVLQRDVRVIQPAHAAATTGESRTFKDCFVLPPLEIQEGEEFDTLRVRLQSPHPEPVVAAWTASS